MKKELIKNKYKEKIELIKLYNESYYNKDIPLVNDGKFDKLKKEIFDLEKKYFF